MKITVTTLSENIAGMPDILAEWGLSTLVEVDGIAVLLDTGRGISASHNADVLGVDIGKIARIVLSHGHFDHIGGLHHLLSRQIWGWWLFWAMRTAASSILSAMPNG